LFGAKASRDSNQRTMKLGAPRTFPAGDELGAIRKKSLQAATMIAVMLRQDHIAHRADAGFAVAFDMLRSGDHSAGVDDHGAIVCAYGIRCWTRPPT
jgi:hypothetical protein